MVSRFNLSRLSIALLATLGSTALAAAPLELQPDDVQVQPTDLPVDGSRQAIELENTRVLGTAEEELK